MAVKILVKGKKNTRVVKVLVDYYGDDDQLVSTLTLKAEFEISSTEEWKQLTEEQELTQAEILRLKTKDVSSDSIVDDVTGQPVPFSAEVLEALLEDQNIVIKMFQMLLAVQTGQKASAVYKALKAKN